MPHHRFRALAGALVLLSLLACGKKETLRPADEDPPVPDFSLVDVNPNSPTHGQSVSPRQSLNEVSAWYFAWAT
jgi:hypothetical protein